MRRWSGGGLQKKWRSKRSSPNRQPDSGGEDERGDRERDVGESFKTLAPQRPTFATAKSTPPIHAKAVAASMRRVAGAAAVQRSRSASTRSRYAMRAIAPWAYALARFHEFACRLRRLGACSLLEDRTPGEK